MNNITSPSQVSSMHWPPGPVMGVHVQQVWPASAPRLLVLVSGERAIWALKSPADRDWHQLTSGSQPVIKVAIKWKFFFCCDNVRVYKLGNRKKIKKIGETKRTLFKLKFKFFTKLNLFHQYTYTMYTLKTERFINLVFDKKNLFCQHNIITIWFILWEPELFITYLWIVQHLSLTETSNHHDWKEGRELRREDQIWKTKLRPALRLPAPRYDT